jgi:hypothetical protein
MGTYAAVSTVLSNYGALAAHITYTLVLLHSVQHDVDCHAGLSVQRAVSPACQLEVSLPKVLCYNNVLLLAAVGCLCRHLPRAKACTAGAASAT